MAHRIKHKVETTMDRIVDYAASVGLSGTATGLSASLIFSTEQHCTVSGTSPGLVALTVPFDFTYPRMVSWGADLIMGGVGSFPGNLSFGGNFAGANAGAQYSLLKRAFTYQTGSVLADGSDLTRLNTTAGGGAQFRFAINQLQCRVTGNVAAGNITTVSGTIVDPVDSGVPPGYPVATINVWAKFRDTTRVR